MPMPLLQKESRCKFSFPCAEYHDKCQATADKYRAALKEISEGLASLSREAMEQIAREALFGPPRIMQCDEPECRRNACTHSKPHKETDICTRACCKGPGKLAYCAEVEA